MPALLTDEEMRAMVARHVAESLPPHVLRSLARNCIRREIGILSLEEAARWLKWESPEALRRALARAGVDKVKQSSRMIHYWITDLRAFLKSRTVKAKSRRGKIVRMEGV